jgi:hypothetical protein
MTSFLQVKLTLRLPRRPSVEGLLAMTTGAKSPLISLFQSWTLVREVIDNAILEE